MVSLPATATGQKGNNLALEDMISRAESFGKVIIFGRIHHGEHLYRVTIEFATTTGISLESSSEVLPLKDAIKQATERARNIRNQFK